jgi:hypothetical protein
MSLSQIDTFKQLFIEFQPGGEGELERKAGIQALQETLEIGASRVKQIRGPNAYGENGGGSLADVRDEVDGMLFAWPQLEWRWGEMESPKVKGALDQVGSTIAGLKNKAATAKFKGTTSESNATALRGILQFDVEQLERMHQEAVKQLEARKSKKTGDRTIYSKEVGQGGDKKLLIQAWNSKTESNEWHTEEEWKELKDKSGEFNKLTTETDGLLIKGWNANTKKDEWHSKEEWQHLDDRLRVPTPTKETSSEMIKLKEVTGTFKMKTDDGKPNTEPRKEKETVTPFGTVLLQKTENQFVGAFEVYNKWERNASQNMRKNLSESLNKRVKGDNPVLKKGVENNCDMASKLAGLLKPDKDQPEFDPVALFQKNGLLTRTVGTTVNQGGFAKEQGKTTPNPETVMKEIFEAAENLKNGNGKEGDANKITQFIAAFIDGITEVNEGNEIAAKQLDMLWKRFAAAFGLDDNDKKKLLDRVEGYKEIAGGHADTISGKGGRKKQTRAGLMPNDPNYKIDEEDALIGGDISGSMQSQLLAQELAESLMGGESGKKIKGRGDPIQITDKALLNARVLDALALTAGGKNDEQGDVVFHTGWEMINGMRGITGAPEIDQMSATAVMISMGRGTSYTDAMEAVLPRSKIPWL